MRLEPAWLCGTLGLLLAAPPAVGAPWVPVGTYDDVAVTSRLVPGQDMPEFRGEAVVKAGLYEIMAVIDDASRHCEWMARCMESTVVRELRGLDRILYQRLNAPWPVSDRDLLVQGSLKINRARKEIISSFRAVKHKAKPPRDNVVRIQILKGFYRLTAVDDQRTRVVYQVLSDPGGSLPRWLARKATRKIPADTIIALRSQVKRTRGQYTSFMKRYNPAHGGKIPKTP